MSHITWFIEAPRGENGNIFTVCHCIFLTTHTAKSGKVKFGALAREHVLFFMENKMSSVQEWIGMCKSPVKFQRWNWKI